MHTITLDLSFPPACPQCQTIFPQHRIRQSRRNAEAIGICEYCRRSTRILLPEVPKKLVYLDQSFLSDVLPTEALPDPTDIKQRIFSQLLELKARQKIFIVVSNIHFAETAAIPNEWVEKRDRLLALQNKLADGVIAADVTEVFIHQQRRKLETPLEPECFPPEDIGLKDPFRYRLGTLTMPTNTWLGRLYQPLAATENRKKLQAHLRNILEHQALDLSTQCSRENCLSLVREKWRADLQSGIIGVRECAEFLATAERQLETSFSPSFKFPPMPEPTPFQSTVQQIVDDLGKDTLGQLEQMLAEDPTGGCASIRLRTALEAEVLWAWRSCNRTGGKFDDRKYGVSRLNDINHISAFLPYVDALTTDDDSARLCQRTIAKVEVGRAKGRLFSAETYVDFETWLDTLALEQSESPHPT